MNSYLLHHLVESSAQRVPLSPALKCRGIEQSYAQLAALQQRVACGLVAQGIQPGQRVGIFLSKCFEWVAGAFGASQCGCVFVPINPVLKPQQVMHILNDCGVSVLLTSSERLAKLGDTLNACDSLELIVLTGTDPEDIALPNQDTDRDSGNRIGKGSGPVTIAWDNFITATASPIQQSVDTDLAAILYTSGSTGKPKGVMLSHRNLMVGASSVVSYLENTEQDRILAVLPFSFDAGFSQLTTAFLAGACCVMLDYLLPHEVIKVAAQEQITGITGVPPLWIQLSGLKWPEEVQQQLRYIANTGGKMPVAVLSMLRQKLPHTRPFLMYGLTEAFRSTFLPPDELDRRPESIGKAIPNAQVLVLRDDLTPCDINEPGELVHRGPLVSQGYWNDHEKTGKRFKPLVATHGGSVLPEYAVFSGDTVRCDQDGFLYFIGRRDEMIKSSGYRISPVEIEEVLYAVDGVVEAAVFGVADDRLGQTITACVFTRQSGEQFEAALLSACREMLPGYMVPNKIVQRSQSLPRNPNGKIDRAGLAALLASQSDTGAGLTTNAGVSASGGRATA